MIEFAIERGQAKCNHQPTNQMKTEIVVVSNPPEIKPRFRSHTGIHCLTTASSIISNREQCVRQFAFYIDEN